MTSRFETLKNDGFVVYLVDVNTEARLLLARHLEAKGYEVKHFAAGALLLRALDGSTAGAIVSGKNLTPISVYPGVPVAPADPADAFALLETLKAREPVPPFIVYDDELTVKEAVALMEAGAMTVIERPDLKELEEALWRAQTAGVNEVDRAQKFLLGWQALTDRERDVVKYLARGMTNREIAETLGGLSPKTIQAHCSEIFKKTDCHGRFRVVKMMKALEKTDSLKLPS